MESDLEHASPLANALVPASLTPRAEHIRDVAGTLFYHRGIHAVGVDTIAAESGVTKRTLYDRFGSKDAVVVAYLQDRHRRWWDVLDKHLKDAHEPRVLALVDAYIEGVEPAGRGCAFLDAAGELPLDHPAQAVIHAHKAAVRARIAELISEGNRTPTADGALADHIFLLLEGAIAHQGVDGDDRLLQRVRELTAQLVV